MIHNFWCFPFDHSCEISRGEYTYFKGREIKLSKLSVFYRGLEVDMLFLTYKER